MPVYPIGYAMEEVGDMIKSGIFSDKRYARLPVLIGETGIGKSTCINKWCEDNGYGYVSVWFNTMEDNGDLLGKPFIDGENQTSFATPSSFPNVERDGEKGVFVLEEINSIPQHLVEALKCLISEGKIGDWTLPDNWFLLGTSNPAAEDKNFQTGADYETLYHDKAIRARMIEIPVCVSLKDWIGYTEEIDGMVHPDLGLFLTHHSTKDKNTDMFSLASPRQWSTINAYLNKIFPHTIFKDDMTQEKRSDNIRKALFVADGVIKETAGFTAPFQEYLTRSSGARPLSPEEIVEDIDGSIAQFIKQKKNIPWIQFTVASFAAFIVNMDIVNVGDETKPSYHLQDRRAFDAFQKILRNVAPDICYMGVLRAMKNPAYRNMFKTEDTELFDKMRQNRKDLEENIQGGR